MKKNSSNKKILIVLIAAYVIFTLGSQQIHRYKLNNIVKANDAKIIQEQKETQVLQQMKEENKTDEHIEKIAREKLGYVKPGEKVYIDRGYKK
jgi:cell division protein FtsL